MTAAAGARLPKQKRSRATRQRLLESAIDCLATLGWAATTVTIVAEQAGVSRGAAQHHFPTREDLVIAALEFISDSRAALIRDTAGLPDGPGRTEAVIVRIVSLFTDRLFKAALQVWTAAAADDALKQRIRPLEARFGRAAHHLAVQLLAVDDTDPVAHRLVQATLDLARGLGLADLLNDDSARRDQIVRQWAATLDAALWSQR